MAIARNPDLPIFSPGEFRRRVRPYLPGTVLELTRLWPRARNNGYERGQRFLVGPYCSGCGHKVIWLCRADRSVEMTADRRFLKDHFEIVVEGSSRFLYTFPKPWPPTGAVRKGPL
jgi:hypothetical protein